MGLAIDLTLEIRSRGGGELELVGRRPVLEDVAAVPDQRDHRELAAIAEQRACRRSTVDLHPRYLAGVLDQNPVSTFTDLPQSSDIGRDPK